MRTKEDWFDERKEAHAIAAKCQYDDIYDAAIASFKRLRAALSVPGGEECVKSTTVDDVSNPKSGSLLSPNLERGEKK